MKKPVVDYRELRLSNITSPRFSHLLLLLGWVGYFILYALTENLIPVEDCYPVKMFLDDIIPFCEYFVIPYVFWYLLIVVSLGYFALYDTDSFRKLSVYIIITQVVAMIVYISFPTRQDLRPVSLEALGRDNVFLDLISIIYGFDTSTGVCPSLHVAYSFGIASVWLKYKEAKCWWKVFVVIAVALICLSTMFIKQHSAVDFFAALPVCLLAELIVFRKKYFKKKLT